MPISVGVLRPEECQRIHDSALRLLQTVGIAIADEESRQILQKAGARVAGTSTVYLPPELVAECLAMTPRVVELAGSDGHRLLLPDGQTHYCSRVKYPRQQDYPPETDHVPTLGDIVHNCRLANALPQVEAVFVLDGSTADVADDVNWLLTPATVLSSTCKHIISPSIHLTSARFWAETAAAAAPGGDLRKQPLLTIEVSPHSPLRLDADTAQVEVFAARQGIPLLVLSLPIAGVTSPLTIAGTLLVGVAEMLALITLAQVVNPGTPILYGGNSLTFNMHTAAVCLGDPEAALLGAGEMAMAHFYGIPNYRVTGFTDAFYPDVQAGIEKTMACLMGVLSGSDLLTLGGALGTSTIISYEQIVIDHDLFEVANRVRRGIEVSTETLALEVIEQIGHQGGEYLAHEHTIKWLRTPERYFGGSFNRKPGMDPSTTMLANAHAQVQSMLQTPAGAGVAQDVRERVQRYARDHGVDVLHKIEQSGALLP